MTVSRNPSSLHHELAALAAIRAGDRKRQPPPDPTGTDRLADRSTTS
jgi:hypothetical protein